MKRLNYKKGGKSGCRPCRFFAIVDNEKYTFFDGHWLGPKLVCSQPKLPSNIGPPVKEYSAANRGGYSNIEASISG